MCSLIRMEKIKLHVLKWTAFIQKTKSKLFLFYFFFKVSVVVAVATSKMIYCLNAHLMSGCIFRKESDVSDYSSAKQTHTVLIKRSHWKIIAVYCSPLLVLRLPEKPKADPHQKHIKCNSFLSPHPLLLTKFE